MRVLQKSDASGTVDLRGLIVIGPGQTIADICKMLLTELQLCPTRGWWDLKVASEVGDLLLTNLNSVPPSAELLPLLPPLCCSLVVGNCPPICWDPKFKSN